jgi:hypothetical protein
MKKVALIIALLAVGIGTHGCASAKAAGNAPQLGTWVRVKAALSARFTNGKAALQQANDAKANAKSYRMRVEMRLHPGDPFITEEEVSCPDKIHMSAMLGDKPMYDAYRVAAVSYVKDQDRWVQSPVPPDVYPCGSNPGAPVPWAILNEGRDMSSALAQLVNKTNATVSVGNLAVMNGAPCQEWEVAFGHPSKKGSPGMGNMRYTICIDTATHLPAQVVMGSGGIVVKYYDWNRSIAIAPPV